MFNAEYYKYVLKLGTQIAYTNTECPSWYHYVRVFRAATIFFFFFTNIAHLSRPIYCASELVFAHIIFDTKFSYKSRNYYNYYHILSGDCLTNIITHNYNDYLLFNNINIFNNNLLLYGVRIYFFFIRV